MHTQNPVVECSDLQVDKPIANRVFGQFGYGVKVQFAHDVASMNIHRAGGNVQRGADLW